MKKRLKKIALPIGPILSIILIGILLLSSLLDYRSIKVQRFLEPALALSEPRLKFNQRINNIIIEEFGSDEGNRLKFKSNSLIIDRSLLFFDNGAVKDQNIKKISSVLLKILNDQDVKKYINLIIVGVKLPMDDKRESEAYNISKKVMDLLFTYEPRLKKDYNNYFTSSVIWSDNKKTKKFSIEFKFVPSEQLHIDVLQKLIKYAE